MGDMPETNEEAIMSAAREWFADTHVIEILENLPKKVVREAATRQARVCVETAIEARQHWEDVREGDAKPYWDDMVEKMNTAYKILCALEGD